MRISELARRGGLPIATVKYYLREGLLPAGESTAATQAQYSELHLERLLLIRALLGPGGLSIQAARAVLDVVDDPTTSVHEALGAAHRALPSSPAHPAPEDLGRARSLLGRWGWKVDDASPSLTVLAVALHALQAARFDTPDELLDRYAHAAATLAEEDVASVPLGSTADAVRFVVIGTVLLEPVLLALRRLAQENASTRNYPPDHNQSKTGPTR